MYYKGPWNNYVILTLQLKFCILEILVKLVTRQRGTRGVNKILQNIQCHHDVRQINQSVCGPLKSIEC